MSIYYFIFVYIRVIIIMQKGGIGKMKKFFKVLGLASVAGAVAL